MPFTILRYPGGKGRFAPNLAKNLNGSRILIEPFAGGASAGLTLLKNNQIDRLILIEKDIRVAKFWEKIRDDAFFASRVKDFKLAKKVNVSDDGLDNAIETKKRNHPLLLARDKLEKYLNEIKEQDLGMWTLVQNRCAFGGYLDGDLLVRGFGRPTDARIEEGRRKYDYYEGVGSQWNSETLAANISQVHRWFKENKIEFIHGDMFEHLSKYPDAFAFVDPPYTLGKDTPGESLYKENEIDHLRLFKFLKERKGAWIATYNNDAAVVGLCKDFDFQFKPIRMLRTHADADKNEKNNYKEIVICPRNQTLDVEDMVSQKRKVNNPCVDCKKNVNKNSRDPKKERCTKCYLGRNSNFTELRYETQKSLPEDKSITLSFSPEEILKSLRNASKDNLLTIFSILKNPN